MKKDRYLFSKPFWKMNAYAAGDMLQGVDAIATAYYTVFLWLVVGMSPWLVGIMILAVRIVDGITDVIMGLVIDRTRTKFGSCRPYFVLAAPLILVGTTLMWSGFGISGAVAQFAWFFFAIALQDTALSVGRVTYEAYLPKITTTYKERFWHTNVRMIYSGIALTVVIYIFETIVNARVAQEGLSYFTDIFTPENQIWFTRMGAILGAVFSLPLLIVAIGTREGALPPLAKERQTIKSLMLVYKELLSNKTYRKFVAFRVITVFLAASTGAVVTLIVLAIYGNIQISIFGITTISLMFLVINVSGAVEIGFFVPNVALMRKYGKHSPYLLCLPLLVLASGIGLFISAGMPLWLFLIAMALLGAGRSCLGFVNMSLLPDIADVDEMIYGKRREGGTSGLNAIIGKWFGGVSSFVLGIIYTAFGLVADDLRGGAIPSAGAINALRVIFGVIPIICSALIIAVAATYKLDKKRHDMIKLLIEEKHKTGFVNATDEQKLECEKLAGKKFEDMWIGR